MAARHWLGTLYNWERIDVLPAQCVWLRGQEEICPTTGRHHYQLIASFSKPQRLAAVKRLIGSGHWEATRSEAAKAYVWKEETSVPGTRFELGSQPLQRNDPKDWQRIRDLAKAGNLDEIPGDVFVRYYRSLTSIAADYGQPPAIERTVNVYWGRTGTGKSKLAWEEAGLSAYSKDPRNKWWCGYQGQTNVIIDEFRGVVDISHLLRWLDRYPVRVELKGSSKPFLCQTIWITSNLAPEQWYPDLDQETKDALYRRLTNIRHFE